MTTIVEQLSANGLKIDIYKDGDCVIEAPSPGYFQLPAEMVAQMALRAAKKDDLPKIKVSGPAHEESLVKLPMAAAKPQSPPAVGAGANASRIVINAAMRRRIKPLEGPDARWECIIMIDGQQDIRQVYEGRKFARQASPQTAIGTLGRIA